MKEFDYDEWYDKRIRGKYDLNNPDQLKIVLYHVLMKALEESSKNYEWQYRKLLENKL